MNPSHKQKNSQEPDAPQWYIDAYLDAMTYGTSIVLFRNGQEPEHIPFVKFVELREQLKDHEKMMEKFHGLQMD